MAPSCDAGLERLRQEHCKKFKANLLCIVSEYLDSQNTTTILYVKKKKKQNKTKSRFPKDDFHKQKSKVIENFAGSFFRMAIATSSWSFSEKLDEWWATPASRQISSPLWFNRQARVSGSDSEYMFK